MGRLRKLVAIIAAVVVFATLPGDLVSNGTADAQQGATIPQHIYDALAAGETVELILSGVAGDGSERSGVSGRQGAQSGLDALDGTVSVDERFELIDAVTTTITSVEQLELLASHPAVGAISMGSEQATRFVDESIAIVGADVSHAAGLFGEGVTVAIVDGGIEATHDDLADRVAYEACFIRDIQTDQGFCPGNVTERFGPGSAPDDSLSHGTYVAGVIAGAGGLAPMGVAPQADLEIYKIFEGATGGFLSDLVRILEHIALDRPDIDVVNLSFGFDPKYTASCDADYVPLFDAIQLLRTRGVVVVAASGNLGLSSMGAPACLTNVVSVAASVDIDGDPTFGEVADFSHVSTVTDLAAPGTQVETTKIGNTTAFVQGTSFAAATVSACAALIRESGLLSANAVENRLRTSSTMAPNPGGRSLPLVDCAAAPRAIGDVNCSNSRTVVDGLLIAQFVVGIRFDHGSCPLADVTTQVNAAGADLNADGAVNVVDALLVTRCVAGHNTDFC